MTFRAWEDDDLNSAGRVLVGLARDDANRHERARAVLNDELSMVASLVAKARIAIGHMSSAKIAEGCRGLDTILERPMVSGLLRNMGRVYAQDQAKDGGYDEDAACWPIVSNASWWEGYKAFLDEMVEREMKS